MKEAFPGISKSPTRSQEQEPLSFKHYNASVVVAGKTMAEHLRFSVAYWHAFETAARTSLAAQPASCPGTTVPTPSPTPRTASAPPSSSSKSWA